MWPKLQKSWTKTEPSSHLEISKWDATSPHESQSSAVIRYMFANPLTALASSGVTPVSGDSEYNMGWSSCFKI